MDFNDYQHNARQTAIYPSDQAIAYCALGLTGEAGEVADKIKKIIRDKGGKFTEEDREEIAKELGDVLWYIANLSFEMNLSLDHVAKKNIEKLSSRLERGVLGGSGDNR